MKVRHLITFILIQCFIAAGGALGAPQQPPPDGSAVVTQREFAAMLISAFRWDGGLPKEPKEIDYLAILEGKRSFRFEAEDHYNVKRDTVTVMNYSLFGPFRGRGWVSGVSEATTVHFKVFIPVAGEYTFSVASKGDGQSWTVGDKVFTVNTGSSLREEKAGAVNLAAGFQEITAVIPPEGGVDYLAFEAPPLAPIEPISGWRFSAPLKLGELAEIAAALLGWEDRLPSEKGLKPTVIAVSEAMELPPTVKKTDIGYLGQFSSKKWVRAGYDDAQLDIPLTIEAPGLYGLKIRYLGEKLDANLDGEKIVRAGKPYLEWIDLGLHRLLPGKHTLQLVLPPMGGADVVTLEKRKSTPADYMELVGLHGDPTAGVTRAEADKVLTSLVERFTGRK